MGTSVGTIFGYLILDVAVDLEVDLHADRVPLLLGQMPDEARAAGQQREPADRLRGEVEIGEDRTTGDWANFYGLVHDDYALFEGEWRFARRQYQTLARGRLDRMQAFPLLDRPV